MAGCIAGIGSCEEVEGDVSGVAPASRLVIQSILDDQGLWRDHSNLMDALERVYLEHKARIVNLSWGLSISPDGSQYLYSQTEQPGTVDLLTHRHPELLFVIGVGNEPNGDGVPRAGGFAASKNGIVVGSIRSRWRQDQFGEWTLKARDISGKNSLRTPQSVLQGKGSPLLISSHPERRSE